MTDDRSGVVRRGCRRMRTVLAVTAVVFTNPIAPCTSFNNIQTTSKSTISKTSLAFQQSENSAHLLSNERFATQSTRTREMQPTSNDSSFQKIRAEMPTWLSIENGDFKDSNLATLSDFMRDSYFTEKEIKALVEAIEDAASGDAYKVAGAAEFCLLLAETMEMGLDALIAAAFHYCSCVSARERALTDFSDNNIFSRSSLIPHSSIPNYGNQIAEIEADSRRLKQLEVVAASVFAQSQGRLGRVTPNSHDAENLRHLLLTETKDWRSLAIRSAACLYRLRGLLKANLTTLTPEAGRTAREAFVIYAPLASRLGMHRLKNELESAAFRILYPRQYRAVTSFQRRSSTCPKLSESMNSVLKSVKSDIALLLGSDKEFRKQVADFSVTARVKEPYSMWKKMLRLGHSHVLQVPDALALRVVLDAKKSKKEPDEIVQARERALCYYAQKLCQSKLAPLDGNPRFKDYIAKPKRNGYQSLHYTAGTSYDGEDWTLEVQVRSSAMHSVAEFGFASHWDYKATQKTNAATESKESENMAEDADRSSLEYLRSLQQWRWDQHGGRMDLDHLEKWDASAYEPVATNNMWHSHGRQAWIRKRTERLKPYIEALTDVQSDLARDHVFVFLTQQREQSENDSCSVAAEGKVLALPAGACVLDALRETERTLGLSLMRNEVFALNGIETSVTRQLQNGDILGIQCSSRTPAMA